MQKYSTLKLKPVRIVERRLYTHTHTQLKCAVHQRNRNKIKNKTTHSHSHSHCHSQKLNFISMFIILTDDISIHSYCLFTFTSVKTSVHKIAAPVAAAENEETESECESEWTVDLLHSRLGQKFHLDFREQIFPNVCVVYYVLECIFFRQMFQNESM